MADECVPRCVASGRNYCHVLAGRKRASDRLFKTSGNKKAEAVRHFAAAAPDEPFTPVRYRPHGAVRSRPRAAMCTLFAAVNLGIGAVRGPIAPVGGTIDLYQCCT